MWWFIAVVILSLSSVLPAAEFLGPEKYWRPRENMVFYLFDESGGGFDLRIDLRDMNIYSEGMRDAFVFVIGPDGRILTQKLLPDDGVIKNDPKYKDGCADIGLDFRYRAYHRLNSPGGYPPGKARADVISDPGKIPPRSFMLKIPDAGKGVYRLAVAGCWDHWFSVTPSRKMSGALHPGKGAFYLHADQFADVFLFLPPGTGDVSVALTEEIQPFNWSVTAEIDGKTIGEVHAKRFYNYTVLKNLPEGKVLRLKISGRTTGAMLHLKGIPFLVCEDEAAARKFSGGVEEPSLKILNAYRSDEAWLKRARSFSNAFGFRDFDGKSMKLKEKDNPSLWRSSWWDFWDGNGIIPETSVPADVKNALTDLYEKWALNRYVMELGTCTNQWGKILENMAKMYEFCRSPVILEVLRYNVRRMCTVNSIGRVNPDADAFKSGREADAGRIDNGIMAECLGHDNEYNLETDAHMSRVYQTTKQQEIVDYQSAYYRLKTHLTLSRTGSVPTDIFYGTCSPTDANFRTRYYTHKSGALLDLIPYGTLWDERKQTPSASPKGEVWPFLEKTPFRRDFDGRYFAVNTGHYYAIFYTGPSFPCWQAWEVPDFDGNSMEYVGFSGMAYGGWQAYPNKSGGLSALWIPGCGPLILANNHNVMYANTLWGENRKPAVEKAEPNVNAAITADSYCNTVGTFDPAGNLFFREGVIPDTPLYFKRRIEICEKQLKVEITICAKEDFLMKSFYEAIPFFSDQRKLAVDGVEMSLPASVVTPIKNITRETEGFSAGTMRFSGRELRLAALSGKGAEIRLDGKYLIVVAAPLRYRELAAGMSSFNIQLPHEWRKGMIHTLRYAISIPD